MTNKEEVRHFHTSPCGLLENYQPDPLMHLMWIALLRHYWKRKRPDHPKSGKGLHPHQRWEETQALCMSTGNEEDQL